MSVRLPGLFNRIQTPLEFVVKKNRHNFFYKSSANMAVSHGVVVGD